jgi:hypothetical protein
MDEKKQNDMDKQIEAENSDVSCAILEPMQGFLIKFLC